MVITFVSGQAYQLPASGPYPVASDVIWTSGGLHIMTWNMSSVQPTWSFPTSPPTPPLDTTVSVGLSSGSVEHYSLGSPIVELPTEKHFERTAVLKDGASVIAVFMLANTEFVWVR